MNYGNFTLPLGNSNYISVELTPDNKTVTSDLRVAFVRNDNDNIWNDGVSVIEFLVTNLFEQGIDVVGNPAIVAAIEETLNNLNGYSYD